MVASARSTFTKENRTCVCSVASMTHHSAVMADVRKHEMASIKFENSRTRAVLLAYAYVHSYSAGITK